MPLNIEGPLSLEALSRFEDFVYFSSEIEEYLKTKSIEEKQLFNRQRVELSNQLATLKTQQLLLINEKLSELTNDLKEGIESLEQQIRDNNNMIATLSAFARVLDFITSVASLVVRPPK